MGAEAAGAQMASQAAQKYLSTGVNVVGGVMSLIEANKQAAAKQEADKAAAAAAAEAKKQLSQNFFQGLQLPMDAYNRAMREVTAQQMQALSAMKESDPRDLAGGVGRLQMATNDYLAKEREDLANKLFDLDKLKAAASKDVAENIGEFEMQRAKGAQMASMAAEKARVAAMNAALNQFGSAFVGAEGVLNPTYSKTEDRQLDPVNSIVETPNINTPSTNIEQSQSSLAGQLAALNYKSTPMTGYDPNQVINPYALGWQGAPYLLPY